MTHEKNFSRRAFVASSLFAAGGLALPRRLHMGKEAEETRDEGRNNSDLEGFLASVDPYLRTHKDSWVYDDLLPFLALESISAKGETEKEDAYRWKERLATLTFMQGRLEKLGFRTEIHEREGEYEGEKHKNAFLLASYTQDPDAFTLLCYNHLDVQPITPTSLPVDPSQKDSKRWHTFPFPPKRGKHESTALYKEKVKGFVRSADVPLPTGVRKDERVYTRGSTDDKGPSIATLRAIETWMQANNKPPLNMKVLLEVGEESGSVAAHEFVAEKKEQLKADAVLITDGISNEYGLPFMNFWLRGLIKGEIHVSTLNNAVHSGERSFVDNPQQELAYILSALKEPQTGKILFPEVYHSIAPLTPEQRDYFAEARKYFHPEEIKKKLGLSRIIGKDPFASIYLQPTFDLHGIFGGTRGTIISPEAIGAFTFRTLPGQDKDHIIQGLEQKVRKVAKALGLADHEVSVRILEYALPFTTDFSHPLFRLAEHGLKTAYQTSAFEKQPAGGTEPIAAHFQEILGIPVIMTGPSSPDDHYHGINESFLINYGLFLGIKSNLAQMYLFGKEGKRKL